MTVQIEISGHNILLDIEDASILNSKGWDVFGPKKTKYLRNTSGKKIVFFHRLILGVPDGLFVDHINGNSLDNRKENLRVVTMSQNNRNMPKRTLRPTSSRFKGVNISKGRWRARIWTDLGRLELGNFEDEVEAAFFYDCASLRHHGEHGKTNFLPLVK